MDNTLRVHRLAGYGLEVPDVGVAETFFSAFGLQPQRAGDVLEMRTRRGLTPGEPPEIIVMQGNAQKRLQHIAFGACKDDLPRFDEHLRRLGITPARPPFGAVREGLWFQDPWGTWICLVAAEEIPRTSPKASTGGPRVDRHLWRDLERSIKPNKLGHALIFTHEWEKSEAFLIQ